MYEPKIGRRCLLNLAGAVAILPLTSILAADQPEELKKFEGKWVSNSSQAGESVWKFEGNKLEIEAGSRKYKIEIKIDSTVKPDKTIEFVVTADSPNAKNFTGPGIYKFDGEDKLSVCFGSEVRPTEYQTKDDFSAIYFELKKSK